MNTANIQNMFDNGFDATVNFTVEQHLELVDQIHEHKIMNKKWDEQQVINFSRYFLNVPDVVVFKIWHKIMGNTVVSNTKRLHQIMIDGTSPYIRLTNIMNDKERYSAIRNELNLPW